MLKTPLTLAFSVIGFSLPPALFFAFSPARSPRSPCLCRRLLISPHPSARASSTAQPDQGRLQREVPSLQSHSTSSSPPPVWACCLPSLCPFSLLLPPPGRPRDSLTFAWRSDKLSREVFFPLFPFSSFPLPRPHPTTFPFRGRFLPQVAPRPSPPPRRRPTPLTWRSSIPLTTTSLPLTKPLSPNPSHPSNAWSQEDPDQRRLLVSRS